MLARDFLRKPWVAAALACICASATAHAYIDQCKAQSGTAVPAIVELYTSEGCNSCPPADQWLSKLVASGTQNVIALAFHVDYWDYIGWKDAFAKPAYGERHSALVRGGGATTVYTPQVFVNGRDDRSWIRENIPSNAAQARAKLVVSAQWDGVALALKGQVTEAREPLRIRYAFTENGITTLVKAGENKGETLRHDALVREHAMTRVDHEGAFSAQIKPLAATKRSHSQLHVIAETMRGEPVAAVTLKCAS